MRVPKRNMNVMRTPPRRQPSGFTLVEILTVIVIIGILAGLAIPAITRALGTAKEAAIRTEIDVMSQAMEAYKLEHGDYPPDFSDWEAVERHFRSAFPGIDNNELRILAQFTHYAPGMLRMGDTGAPNGSGSTSDPRIATNYAHYPHAIDRAEALVFCLGGYSKDAKRPFTGQGGPLVKRGGAAFAAEPNGDNNDYLAYQFNSEREPGFFDFDSPQLTVTTISPAGFSPFNYSTDEKTASLTTTSTNDLGFIYHPDPFPVYVPKGTTMPFVFFNSTGYVRAFGVAPTATTGVAWNSGNTLIHHFLNVYLPAGGAGSTADTGVARPYVSNVPDTTPPATMSGFAVVGPVLQFAENRKFQIVSAGLDSNFGGIIGPAVGPAASGLCVAPSGEYYNPFTTFSPAGSAPTLSVVNKFQDDLCLQTQYSTPGIYGSQPQLDNLTNFTTRTLQSDLP